MSIFVFLPKESVPGLPRWGSWLQLLISFLLWPIHGALVFWLIKGVKEELTLASALLASIILWLGFYLRSIEIVPVKTWSWQNSELTALLWSGGSQIQLSSDCFSITASPSLLWHGSSYKRKRFCVFAAFHPTLRWVRFTFSGWKDRLQDQRLVPSNQQRSWANGINSMK